MLCCCFDESFQLGGGLAGGQLVESVLGLKALDGQAFGGGDRFVEEFTGRSELG